MGIISAVVLLGSGDPAAALGGFRALGFEAQTVSAHGLVITGDADLFAERFHVTLQSGAQGVWVAGPSAPTRTLPTAELPAALRSQVKAVEFEAPLDFGPTDY
jgi:hypothetical protein